MGEGSAEELHTQGCRNLLAAVILGAVKDAQSKDQTRAYHTRRWLRENADWAECLDMRAECIIDWVDGLPPLPQMAFELVWDDWPPEPVTMVQSMPEMEPDRAELESEPVEIEPEPEPEPEPVMMSYTDEMIAHVCGWAVQRGG